MTWSDPLRVVCVVGARLNLMKIAPLMRAAFDEVLTTGGKAGPIPELWDGAAAERAAADIVRRAAER